MALPAKRSNGKSKASKSPRPSAKAGTHTAKAETRIAKSGTRIEQRLAIEHGATQALAEAVSFAEAVPLIIAAVCETLAWECGTCWTSASDNDSLQWAGSWGVPGKDVGEFLEHTRTMLQSRSPGGLLRRTWLAAEPVWLPDVTTDKTFRRAPAALKAGLHSAFAFPIVAGDTVLGVMEFFSREIRQPDADLLDCTTYVGSQIGQYLKRARAEENLSRFRVAMDNSADMIVLIDRKTMRYVDVNETACKLLGYTREELLGMGPHDVLPSSREELERAYDDFIANPSRIHGMHSRYVRKDGSSFPFESTRQVIRAGDTYVIAAISRDISARIAAEEALRTSEARFRSLTQLSSDWYWEQDAELRFTKFEGSGISGSRYEPGAAVVGRSAFEIPGLIEGSADMEGHRARLLRREPFRDFVYAYRDRKGNQYHVSVNGEPIFDQGGSFAGYRGTSRDITARKQAEERIQYLATHDGLTGLPNRVMFNTLLSHAIDGAKRYKRKFAVLFIDLDRFKVINDTLGHAAGDELLGTISGRLKSTVRASDVVGRLGGDEFAVLLQEMDSPHQVAVVARKILSTVIKPMVISGQECRVTASIGISMFPADAEDEATLMKNADVAMYLAKEEGKNNFQFYTQGIKTQSLEKMALETGLRRALEAKEFSLHYQAKKDLQTGAITGVEALLRWNSATLGAVTPAQFIPIAEETGLIVPIGRWVLKSACAQHMAWCREGLPAVPMAVNLSPRQFTDPGLLDDIAAVLRDSGMAAEMLELEITESMVMQNAERAIQALVAIKELGVRLAIDDFGTGYSSLAQLKRFPIDTLKVDRSFIRDIPMDGEDRAITEAIIAMGRTLSLTVIAEGVETEEQQTFLREHACDQMQGYFFSRPVEPEKFAELLRRHVAEEGGS
jgi:diguanylate cyclase (GGDEF)-like protein/PAS domain S-box-containing protein